MTSHPNNEHGVNCGANEKINMDDWKEPAMDKIFELFNKHSKEIEFSGGYSGSVLLYDGFIKAITEALAERDARIKELEAELSRIKDGVGKLETERVQLNSSISQPIVDVYFRSDIDELIYGKDHGEGGE